jgi:hypothetical protein
MWVIFQPRRSAADRIGFSSGASIEAVSRFPDHAQNAEIIGAA